ncbi:hypothetical protein B0J14DRAFT_688089 [Halenospora varia]|nr:hypothetical protein B0J14DRAFT_688089 [Halenospora varia]
MADDDLAALIDFRLPQEIVKVTVGKRKEKQTFYVHKKLLVQNSKEFAKELASQLGEKDNIYTMNLPHADPKHFGVLTKWLYSEENLDLSSGPLQLPTSLALLWQFGAKYGIPSLQNGVMDRLLKVLESAE